MSRFAWGHATVCNCLYSLDYKGTQLPSLQTSVVGFRWKGSGAVCTGNTIEMSIRACWPYGSGSLTGLGASGGKVHTTFKMTSQWHRVVHHLERDDAPKEPSKL